MHFSEIMLSSLRLDCSLYHIYGLLGNSTTIEGWEKDKAAMLRRHGKIEEVGVASKQITGKQLTVSPRSNSHMQVFTLRRSTKC